MATNTTFDPDEFLSEIDTLIPKSSGSAESAPKTESGPSDFDPDSFLSELDTLFPKAPNNFARDLGKDRYSSELPSLNDAREFLSLERTLGQYATQVERRGRGALWQDDLGKQESELIRSGLGEDVYQKYTGGKWDDRNFLQRMLGASTPEMDDVEKLLSKSKAIERDGSPVTDSAAFKALERYKELRNSLTSDQIKDAQAVNWANNPSSYAQLSNGAIALRPEAFRDQNSYSSAVAEARKNGAVDDRQSKAMLDKWPEIEAGFDEAGLKAAKDTESFRAFKAKPENSGKTDEEVFKSYKSSQDWLDKLKYTGGVFGKSFVDSFLYPVAGAAVPALNKLGEVTDNQSIKDAGENFTSWAVESLSKPSFSDDTRGGFGAAVDTTVQTIGQGIGQLTLALGASKLTGNKSAGAGSVMFTGGLQTGLEAYTNVYQTALDSGKTHEEANQEATNAFVSNMPSGFLEAVPVERILSKIPRGLVGKTVKAITSGLSEVATENIQNYANNLVNQAVSSTYIERQDMGLGDNVGMFAGVTALDVVTGKIRGNVSRGSFRTNMRPDPVVLSAEERKTQDALVDYLASDLGQSVDEYEARYGQDISADNIRSAFSKAPGMSDPKISSSAVEAFEKVLRANQKNKASSAMDKAADVAAGSDSPLVAEELKKQAQQTKREVAKEMAQPRDVSETASEILDNLEEDDSEAAPSTPTPDVKPAEGIISESPTPIEKPDSEQTPKVSIQEPEIPQADSLRGIVLSSGIPEEAVDAYIENLRNEGISDDQIKGMAESNKAFREEAAKKNEEDAKARSEIARRARQGDPEARAQLERERGVNQQPAEPTTESAAQPTSVQEPAQQPQAPVADAQEQQPQAEAEPTVTSNVESTPETVGQPPQGREGVDWYVDPTSKEYLRWDETADNGAGDWVGTGTFQNQQASEAPVAEPATPPVDQPSRAVTTPTEPDAPAPNVPDQETQTPATTQEGGDTTNEEERQRRQEVLNTQQPPISGAEEEGAGATPPPVETSASASVEKAGRATGAKGVISGKPLPVREEETGRDEEGRPILKVISSFTTDPDTLAEVLHQNGGAERIYIPDEILDSEDPKDEIDNDRIGYNFEKGTGRAYVTWARHSRYPNSPVLENGRTEDNETLEQLYQRDPRRQANSEAQTKGGGVGLAELDEDFVKELDNAPLSELETKDPDAVARELSKIDTMAAKLAEETVTTNDGSVASIGAPLADLIGQAAKNRYLGRLRGIVSGDFADASGALRDVKAKAVRALKSRGGENVGVSLDQQIGDGTNTVGDVTASSQAVQDEQASKPVGEPAVDNQNTPKSTEEAMRFATDMAVMELSDADRKIWLEYKSRMTSKREGGRGQYITKPQQEVANKVSAKARETLVELLAQEQDVDFENGGALKPAPILTEQEQRESEAINALIDRGVERKIRANTNRVLDLAQATAEEKISIKRLLESVSKDKTETALVRFFANWVAKSGHDFSNVELQLIANRDKRANWSGLYVAGKKANSGTIKINTASEHRGSISQTVLHEALHHIVVYKLRPSYRRNPVEQAAYRDLMKVLTHARRQLLLPEEGETLSQVARREFGGDDTFYGLTNIDEMFSETLTNDKFFAWLNSQQPLPGLKTKGAFRTLLDQVWQALKNFFGGVEIRKNSLLSQALDNIMALGRDVQTDAKIAEYNRTAAERGRRKVEKTSTEAVDSVQRHLETAGREKSEYGLYNLAPEAKGIMGLVQPLGAQDVLNYFAKYGVDWGALRKVFSENNVVDGKKYPPEWYDPKPGEVFKDWKSRVDLRNDDLDTRPRIENPETGMFEQQGDDFETLIYRDLGFDPINSEFVRESDVRFASTTPALQGRAASMEDVVQDSISNSKIPFKSESLDGRPALARILSDGRLEIAYDPEAMAIETEGLTDDEAAQVVRKLLGHERIHIAGLYNDYTTKDIKGRTGREKIEAFHDEVMTEEMRQQTADAYVRRYEGMTDAEFEASKQEFLSDKVAVAGEFKRMFVERYLTGESYEDTLKALEQKTGDTFMDLVRGIADYLVGRIRMLQARFDMLRDPRLALDIMADRQMLRNLVSTTGLQGYEESLNAARRRPEEQYEVTTQTKYAMPTYGGEIVGEIKPKWSEGKLTPIPTIPDEEFLRVYHHEAMVGDELRTIQEFRDLQEAKGDNERYWNRNSFSLVRMGDAPIDQAKKAFNIESRNATRAQRRRMIDKSGGWKAAGGLTQNLMDSEVGELIDRKNAAINAANYKVEETARKFNRLVKKYSPDQQILRTALGSTENMLTEVQFAQWKKLQKAAKNETDPTKRQAAIAAADSYRINQVNSNNNKARADRQAALSSLPKELADTVNVMRQHIDGLSRELKNKGLVGSNLQATIGANLEVYLNRSYEIFDNPEWADYIASDSSPEARQIRANAENVFRAQLVAEEARKIRRNAKLNNQPVPSKQQALAAAQATVTNNQIQDLMLQYLRVADTGGVQILGGKNPAKKDLSIIKLRGQIPKEIRDLWGEYKAPDVNYAKTFVKMSSFIATHNFQQDLLDLGLNRATPFFWKEGVSAGQKPAGWVEVVPGATDSPNPNPLAGVYGPPIIGEAFTDLNKTYKHSLINDWITGLTGFAMASKTIYNPPQTYVRNILGNGLIMVAQGYVAQDTKFLSRFADSAFKVGPSLVGARPERSDAVVNYVERMIKLGVMGDNVKANVIKSLTSVVFDRNPDLAFSKTLSGAFDFAKGVNTRLTDAYQAGDDFWKIIAFESERATFAKAFPKATPESLDRMAADRVRDVMPTYSKIPNAVKEIVKRQPYLAPYISWTSEIIRTFANTYRHGWSDATSGNPVLRASGIRRIGWATMSQALLLGVAYTARSMAGMDEEDEERLRRFLPDWQVNSLLMLTGRKEDGKFSFWDLSYLNPYDVLHEPFIAMGREWKDSKSVLSAAATGLQKFADPWTSEQIFFSALMDAARGVTAEGRPIFEEADTEANKWKARAGRIVDSLTPGVVNFGLRMYKAYNGQILPGGRTYNLTDEFLGAITGQRPSELDPLQSFKGRNIPAFNRLMSSANNLATKAYRKSGTPDFDKIKENYLQSNDARLEAMSKLRKDVDALIGLGVPALSVYQTLAASGVSANDIEQIKAGKYQKRIPGDDSIQNAVGLPEFQKRYKVLSEAVKGYPELQNLDTP